MADAFVSKNYFLHLALHITNNLKIYIYTHLYIFQFNVTFFFYVGCCAGKADDIKWQNNNNNNRISHIIH